MGPWEKYGAAPITGPDAKLPGQVAGQGLSNTKTADDIRRARGLEDANRRKAEAEAGIAENNLNRARNKPLGGINVNSQAVSAARAKVQNALILRSQLQDAWRLFKGTQGGKGAGLSSVGEFLPTEGNKQFDAAVQGMLPLARQLFRVPGSGADSDKELKIITDLMPNRFSYDAANVQRFKQLDSMIKDIVRENAPTAGKKMEIVKNKPQKRRVINFDDLPE